LSREFEQRVEERDFGVGERALFKRVEKALDREREGKR
jgi:hypothetical protein